MAAFCYHRHPFLLDQSIAFHPDPTNQRFSGDQPTTPTAVATTPTCLLDQDHHIKTKNLQVPGYSTSMEVDDGSHDQLPTKRKGNNGISQDTRKGKKKKQKENSDDEGVVGYIHVRARSGQATDSHSLAERVRRKKINERMKVLQSIVPGCDKVTAKTLMLDQIINYVHSLQNQVEFLSMKLASANPMFCESGVGSDAFMLIPHQEHISCSMVLPFMQKVQPCKPTPAEGSSTLTTPDNNFHHHPIDHSPPNIHPQVLWDMEKQIGLGNNSFN